MRITSSMTSTGVAPTMAPAIAAAVMPLMLITLSFSVHAACMSDAARAGEAQSQDGPAYERIVLVHRFTVPQKLAWGKISIDLTPAAWRVGGVDGPPAHAAQLSGVLGALDGIEIGARCTGWVEGPNAYPCGFALREIGLAAQSVKRSSGIVMDWTPNPQRAQAAIDARPHADMKGLMAPLPDTQRFVGMHVAPRHLGDTAKAMGAKLEFEIRAVSNRLVPSMFDRASGVVTLCAARQKLAL